MIQEIIQIKKDAKFSISTFIAYNCSAQFTSKIDSSSRQQIPFQKYGKKFSQGVLVVTFFTFGSVFCLSDRKLNKKNDAKLASFLKICVISTQAQGKS